MCVGIYYSKFLNMQRASYTHVHEIKDGHGYSFNWRVIHRNPSAPKTADCSLTAYIAAEMSAFKPVGGGFVRHANMWVDESCGMTIGCVYIRSVRLRPPLIFYVGGISGTRWQLRCPRKSVQLRPC